MGFSRIERLLLFSVGLGLCLLGISSFLIPVGSKSTGHGSIGFPIAYATQIDCYLSGPGGCGYSYDSLLMVLDYLFWVTAAFGISYLSSSMSSFSKMDKKRVG